jgi:hypothetical protein
MKQGVVLFVLILSALGAYSNETGEDSLKNTQLQAGLLLSGGRILRNYPDFPDRSMSFFAGADLSVKTRGNRPWHYFLGYPEAGAVVWYGIPGNDSVLGRIAGICPYLGFDLGRPGSRTMLHLRYGMGFAWISRPYHRTQNPTNNLSGSHLSNVTTLEFMLRQTLAPAWKASAGVGFMHFSNGHTQLPNLGTNIPSLVVGLQYTPQVKLVTPDTSLAGYPRPLQFGVEFGLGWHEFGESTEPVGGAKYPVYSVGFMLSKLTHPVHLWQAGIFINYYTSFHHFIVSQEMYQNRQALHAATVVLFAGHQLMMGRLGLDVKMGLYLWNPFRRKYHTEIIQKPEPLKMLSSNKLGVNYYFFDPARNAFNLYVGIHIKANLGQADFTEFSLGCRF